MEEIYFPSWKQFMAISRRHVGKESTYGLASWIIEKCIEYRSDDEQYNDIVEYCLPQAEKLDGRVDQDTPEPGTSIGYVYLLKSGNNYKIGRTKSLKSRNRALNVSQAKPHEYEHYIETDDPAGVEAYWHNRFHAKRIRKGELFKLDGNDVRCFKKWKNIC